MEAFLAIADQAANRVCAKFDYQLRDDIHQQARLFAVEAYRNKYDYYEDKQGHLYNRIKYDTYSYVMEYLGVPRYLNELKYAYKKYGNDYEAIVKATVVSRKALPYYLSLIGKWGHENSAHVDTTDHIDADNPAYIVPCEHYEPQSYVANYQVHQQFDSEFSKLSDMQRKALWGSLGMGYSIERIAHVLGVSVSECVSLCNVALDTLKATMANAPLCNGEDTGQHPL